MTAFESRNWSSPQGRRRHSSPGAVAWGYLVASFVNPPPPKSNSSYHESLYIDGILFHALLCAVVFFIAGQTNCFFFGLRKCNGVDWMTAERNSLCTSKPHLKMQNSQNSISASATHCNVTLEQQLELKSLSSNNVKCFKWAWGQCLWRYCLVFFTGKANN